MGILLLPIIIFFGYILPRIIIKAYIEKYTPTVNFFPILLIGYVMLLFLMSSVLTIGSSTLTGGNYISMGIEGSIIISIFYIGYRWADFNDNRSKKG